MRRSGKAKRGRPKGSKNHDVVTVEAEPPQPPPLSKCPKCGSTRRAPYCQKVERSISGVKDGKPYGKVVWRRTKCLDCRQHRRDKSFVCEPEQQGVSNAG